MSRIIIATAIHTAIDTQAFVHKAQSCNYSVWVHHYGAVPMFVFRNDGSADASDGFVLAEFLKNNSGLVSYVVIEEEMNHG